MGEKEVTRMALKVDLQCSKCYKKVKKVLCKFPQIRDQVYDEKNNKVIIKVVCCNPEKIRDKLCCKGHGAIKSIEILEPPPPKKPEKPKPAEQPKKDEPLPGEPTKPEEPKKPAEPEPKKPAVPKEPVKPVEPKKPEEPKKPREPEKPKPSPCYPVPWFPVPWYPVPCYPLFPRRDCCPDCYKGRDGGPCGRPVCESWGGGRVRYYDGYCGRSVYDSWGGGGYGFYKSQCTDYICEENPNAACTIM